LSCGCQRKLLSGDKIRTHGMSKTKFYKRWRSMFDRCSPLYICSKDYVGISVCKSWSKFEEFKKDMHVSYLKHREKFGERQTTLDRINVYGNYEANNCRWATFRQQVLNRKKTAFYTNEIS